MAPTVTREELHAAIDAGTAVVLEALGPEHYEKEHLPGARNLPLDRIDELAARVIPTRDTLVVTYCSDSACSNSALARQRLVELGYTDVRVYPDGKQAWVEAGLPVEHGPDPKVAA